MEKSNKKDDYLYIILHMPKTGGSTLREHIIQNFKKEETLFFYIDKENRKFRSKKRIKSHINSLSKKRKDKIKVIIGHAAYYGVHKNFAKKSRYIIFLRNSPEQKISLYNYFRTAYESEGAFKKILVKNKKILTFEEMFKYYPFGSINAIKFFVQKENNLTFKLFEKLTKKITKKELEKAKKLLGKLYFVGLTENKEDFDYIYSLLRIKKFLPNQNISKKFFKIENSKKSLREILPRDKYDQELYKYGKKINRKFKVAHPEFKKNVGKIRLKRKLKLYLNHNFVLGKLYSLSLKLRKRSKIYSKALNLFKSAISLK